MPIVKPTAKSIRPDALEIFTDRAEEQQLLRKLLASEPSASLGLTFLLTQFYGVGGVGKSTLCQRACEIAAAEFKDTVRVVATSFDDSRWKEGSAFTEVSAELCRCLAGQKIVPRLTLTLLSLHGQQTGRNGEVVGGLDAGWAMAFTAMEKGADLTGIPGLGMVVKGAQWVRERSQRQALRQRLTDLGLWPEEQYGKLNILDLEKKLSSALYYDLLDWLKENPGQHVRLLLDGFERLQSSERREDSQRRLQEFIGYFAGPDERDACDRFRVVIFGRNQLRWDEIYEDPTWRDYWNLHLLGGLAEADALDFLKKTRTWLASKGQSALAEALVKYEEKILDASDETKGGQRIFYPFYLNLAVELVERARQSGQELELGRAPAELQDRFFRYLEPHELRALMILALSEVFDESLFDWLARERLIEYPQHSFHSQLRREHSYLQAVEGREGDWRFHRLMEDALHARWQSTAELKREGVNLIKRVLDYYGEPLLAKPERDWADREVELWRRGMEIIVKQGPELEMLNHEEWKTLLETKPWSMEHFRCLVHRVEFTHRILKQQETIFGPEHPDTLISINSLGRLFKAKGNYDEAEALFRHALQGREKLLGSEHPSTLDSMNDLANLLQSKGDYDKSEVLHRRALESRERVLGHEHPDTLRSMNNLAVTLDDLGDYDGAERLCRQALAGRESVLGPEHFETLMSISNLGIYLSRKGDIVGANAAYRRALDGWERTLGPEHPFTLHTVNNLANLMLTTGDFAGAETLCRRALLGRENGLGMQHPDTLSSLKDLGRIMMAKGDKSGAVVLLREHAARSTWCHDTLRYLLACFECLSNNVEDAKRLIAEEITAKPAAREQALKDNDLKAIHEFIHNLQCANVSPKRET
jgi:tetratricopeptide (TPR) repeat protein